MIKGNVKIDRKNLISILQSCLVLILVILVALMMVEIGNLKGTARVINYAGLVRGRHAAGGKAGDYRHPKR